MGSQKLKKNKPFVPRDKNDQIQGFPYWGDGGLGTPQLKIRSPPPPHLEKFLPVDSPPLHQIFIPFPPKVNSLPPPPS